MKSKQFTAFSPFMKQFVSFAAIAGWTRYHNVGHVVRSTAREWHNVINMVDVVKVTLAIITFSFLTVILCYDIMGIISSDCVVFPRPITIHCGAYRFWIIAAPLFVYDLASLLILSMPFSDDSKIMLSVVFLPFLIVGFEALFVIFITNMRCMATTLFIVVVPVFGLFIMANSTRWIQANAHLHVTAKKVFCRCEFVFAALGASFKRKGEIQHSTFTSCCLPDVVSASGGKNRVSVINLADNQDYIVSSILARI